MIYVSDHGESLGEGNVYLHGLPYSTRRTPRSRCRWWPGFHPGMASGKGVNTACVRSRASQPISHDNLFHSVLGLMRGQHHGLRPEAGCVLGMPDHGRSLAMRPRMAPTSCPASVAGLAASRLALGAGTHFF